MVRIAIIGGGPGGYVAAIRAAQLGGQVTLIEKSNLGGTCLNVGCIPTKALLQSAEILEEARQAAEFGIDLEVKGFDWPRVQAKKEAVVRQLVGGVGGLMKVNKVRVVSGTAAFETAKKLKVAKPDGSSEAVEADKIIIASGSVPVMPPISGVKDHPACLDSTGALSLETVPRSLLVIGGGVIGLELATVYRAFGAEVTVVEALPKLLPMMDGELTAMLAQNLKQSGIEILTDARVVEVGQAKKGAAVKVEVGGQAKIFEAEKVLVAVGRRTDTEALGLDEAGIKHDRGRIEVDDKMETSLKDVYAVGDCLGRIMLAHVASVQGEIAAENALGHKAFFEAASNPYCVYTRPEFAGVGLTEEAAKEKKLDYVVGKFPLAANGKALIMNGGQGTVKVLLGREFKEILGVHILGPRATDIIAECALAISLEATVEDLIAAIHAHPTVSEAVREGMLAAEKRAIHIHNK